MTIEKMTRRRAPLTRLEWIAIGVLSFTGIVLVTVAASAQESHWSRPRYDYNAPFLHAGPLTSGTYYDGAGRNVGRTYTDSQGSTTVYDNGGRVVGRTATDSQGTTSYYDGAGRKTGTAVPNAGPRGGRR